MEMTSQNRENQSKLKNTAFDDLKHGRLRGTGISLAIFVLAFLANFAGKLHIRGNIFETRILANRRKKF